MTAIQPTRKAPIRAAATALLASLSLLLTGCFITPGKFQSELVLNGDDTFTFTYEGEIFFLALANLAEMAAGSEEFVARGCFDEATLEDRDCTEAELAQQREEWDAGAEERAAKAQQEAAQMSALMGNVDPSDPAAAEELRQMLLRLKGWESVEDKGDGVFEVRYAITGALTHDFMFPVIEDIPMTSPFVQVILRDDNMVRINAPGFAAENEDNPMGGMAAMAGMGALAEMGGASSEGENGGADAMPPLPIIEGTFRIVTTGAMDIRANNTDEGANPTPTGEVLTWDISPRTKAAPTALIHIRK